MTTITIERAVVERAVGAMERTLDEGEGDRTLEVAAADLREALNAPQPTTMQAAMMSNDRMQIDPVSGNVSINAPQPQPTATQDWEAIAADQAMTIAMQAATIESLKEQRLMQMYEALNAPQPEPVSMQTLHQLLREDGYLTNRQAWELAEKLDAAVFTTPPRREWKPLSLD